jgi:hypothetical protein
MIVPSDKAEGRVAVGPLPLPRLLLTSASAVEKFHVVLP